MKKKCCIVVVKRQVEHGGQKRTKHNVGEPILYGIEFTLNSYGIEWCSLSREKST